jgi:hypothetical protein
MEEQKKEFEGIDGIYQCVAIEGNFYYFTNHQEDVRVQKNPVFDNLIVKWDYYLFDAKGGKGTISPRESMEFKRYYLNKTGMLDINTNKN